MDASDIDRLARLVAVRTRRKYWYMDRDKRDALVSEAYYALLRSLRKRPEWAPGRHINEAVRSSAKNYYRGFGRDLFQTTREAEARKPGRRAEFPASCER